jgi:hypothetical protein
VVGIQCCAACSKQAARVQHPAAALAAFADRGGCNQGIFLLATWPCLMQQDTKQGLKQGCVKQQSNSCSTGLQTRGNCQLLAVLWLLCHHCVPYRASRAGPR